jgi:hypothetical protein
MPIQAMATITSSAKEMEGKRQSPTLPIISSPKEISQEIVHMAITMYLQLSKEENNSTPKAI